MTSAQFTFLVTTVFALSGCSNAPSDSDTKAAIVSGLGIENCKNFKIENFQKVNGIAGNDKRYYRVDVKYALNLLPLPNADVVFKELEAKHHNEELELQKATENATATLEKFSGTPSDKSLLGMQLDNENQKIKYNINNRSTLDAVYIYERYSAGCSKESAYMVGFISSSKKDDLAKGFLREISDSLILIKTDNGWMPAQ